MKRASRRSPKKNKKKRKPITEAERLAAMPPEAWAEHKAVMLAEAERKAREKKGTFGLYGSGMLGG